MPVKSPLNLDTETVANTPFRKRYIQDASKAIMVCDSAFLAHAKYHYSIFNMIEQFDGLYPHSPEYLKEANLDWISNVPYRKGASIIEKASTTRLNLLRSAIYFSQLCFRPFREEDEKNPALFFLTNPEQKKNFEARLTKIFIDTLHRDPKFLTNILLKIAHNQVSWGYAVSQWEEHCVFPEIPEILNVYFERANRIENIKVYIYVFYQRAEDLYALYKEQEAIGWDTSFYIKEGLEEALQWSLQRHEQQTYNSWEDIVRTYDQESLHNTFSKCTDNLTWAWIWNEEVEGGVTQSLFLWNRGLTVMPQGAAKFNLYAGDRTMPNGQNLSYQRHFSDMEIQEVWNLYPNSGITNTEIPQDLRGLASYAYELDISNNIKRNGLNDALAIRLPLPIQAGYGQQMNEVQNVNIIGGMSIFPQTFMPMRDVGSSGIFRDVLAIMQMENSEGNDAISQYDPQVAGSLTDRATDQQVQTIAAEKARQRSDFATVPTFSMRALLCGIYKRLFDDYKKDDPGHDSAQYFQDCIDDYLWPLTGQRGVEEPAFTKKEFRAALKDALDYIALEYTSNDVPSLQLLIQLSQTPEGKRYYMRKLAMANGASYPELEVYFPLQDSPDLNVNDASLALIENFMFWETGEVSYSALQSAVTHLQIHFTKAMQLLQGIKNGMDPYQIWKWYSNMLPHSELHLQQLSQDVYEQEAFKSFMATFKQLRKIEQELARFAQQQAKEIAAQQQGGSQLPPEVQAKIDILEVQAQEKMRRTQEQSQMKGQMMQEKHQQSMELARERHDLQMQEQAQRAALQLIQQEQQGEQ